MTYTLRDTIKEYFDELNYDGLLKSKENSENGTDRFNNFYQDKNKQFKEILYVVDIVDEMKELKKKTGNNYSFSQEGKRFIIRLLKEFSGLMDPLRRGEIYKGDAKFIIEMYTGFRNIFKDAKVGEDLLQRATYKMCNRLDVPMKYVQKTRDQIAVHINKMIDDNLSSYTPGMGINENYVWLAGLNAELEAVKSKWDDLYEEMAAIRDDELFELSMAAANGFTCEQNVEAILDFEYAEEYLEAVAKDKEYQELLKRKYKLQGVPYNPEEYNNIGCSLRDYKVMRKNQKIQKSKLKPFVKNIESEIYEVSDRLVERYEELRREILRKHYPEYEPVDIVETEPDYSELIEAEDLLLKARRLQRARWKSEKKFQKMMQDRHLPEIDYERILYELENVRAAIGKET